MKNPNAFETAPVTPYQFYLVEHCGAKLYREGVDGCYTLEGEFSYADEDAAEAFAESEPAGWGPELGPRQETAVERSLRLNPPTYTKCNSCGDLYCQSRFDCSRR